MMERLKRKVVWIKREVVAIHYACRDPLCPWYAKVVAILVVAYALSPIDLIPDFIPVLGYLDDLVLVPLGVLLVRRMIPADVMARARKKAGKVGKKPKSMLGLVIVVVLWIGAVFLAAMLVKHYV